MQLGWPNQGIGSTAALRCALSCCRLAARLLTRPASHPSLRLRAVDMALSHGAVPGHHPRTESLGSRLTLLPESTALARLRLREPSSAARRSSASRSPSCGPPDADAISHGFLPTGMWRSVTTRRQFIAALEYRMSANLQLQTTPLSDSTGSRALAPLAGVALHTTVMTADRPTVAVLTES